MILENYFRFVLVRPRNSGNVGSALRVMANFGLRDLAVVKMWHYDEEEASLMAASASILLDQIKFFDDLKEAISDRTVVFGTTARRRGKAQRMTIDSFKNFIKENPGEKYAILFGSEKTGLTSEELALCDYYITIDTDQEFRSLNLAQSVGIIAYEIRRTFVKEPEITPPRRISRNTVEKIVDYISKVCEITSAPENGKNNSIRATRGILGRGNVTEKEGKILLWLMRHIWWYISNFCGK